MLHAVFLSGAQSVLEVELLWGQLDRREKELNMSKIGARSVFIYIYAYKPLCR